MKALVAQELSGPSGLVYTDVDDVADGDDLGEEPAGVISPESTTRRSRTSTVPAARGSDCPNTFTNEASRRTCASVRPGFDNETCAS